MSVVPISHNLRLWRALRQNCFIVDFTDSYGMRGLGSLYNAIVYNTTLPNGLVGVSAGISSSGDDVVYHGGNWMTSATGGDNNFTTVHTDGLELLPTVDPGWIYRVPLQYSVRHFTGGAATGSGGRINQFLVGALLDGGKNVFTGNKIGRLHYVAPPTLSDMTSQGWVILDRQNGSVALSSFSFQTGAVAGQLNSTDDFVLDNPLDNKVSLMLADDSLASGVAHDDGKVLILGGVTLFDGSIGSPDRGVQIYRMGFESMKLHGFAWNDIVDGDYSGDNEKMASWDLVIKDINQRRLDTRPIVIMGEFDTEYGTGQPANGIEDGVDTFHHYTKQKMLFKFADQLAAASGCEVYVLGIGSCTSHKGAATNDPIERQWNGVMQEGVYQACREHANGMFFSAQQAVGGFIPNGSPPFLQWLKLNGYDDWDYGAASNKDLTAAPNLMDGTAGDGWSTGSGLHYTDDLGLLLAEAFESEVNR